MDLLQCRVCQNFGYRFTSLFSKSNGASVSQMIMFCAGVQIMEEDDLPPHACSKCCEDATLAYMFVNKCRKSDAELRTQQILKHECQEPESDHEEGHSDELPERLVLSEKQKDHGTIPVPLDPNLFQFEAKDAPGSGYVSLEIMQQCSSDNELEVVDDETTYGENENEEYLYESSEERITEPVTDDEEDRTDDHEAPDEWDPTEASAVFFCCHNDCTLKFGSKRTLKAHLHSQHQVVACEGEGSPPNNTAHRCSNCDRLFPSAEKLKLHAKQLQLKRTFLITGQRRGRPTLYPTVFDAAEKKCCGCLEQFATTEALLAHCEATHAIRQSATDPNRPVQCPICYKLFRSEGHVRTHRIAAYKPRNHRCPTCDASFATASRLAKHEKHHEPERKYQCGVCGVRLKTEQNLKMHALLHREKREVCKTCGLRFHRRSNLKMHQRTHEDTYYYVCPHCPKKHKNQSQLNEHLKVHTGVKPYECRHCPSRFRYFSDRKRHEMGHTGNYPFECDACSKKFIRSLSYNRHVSKCFGASIQCQGSGEQETVDTVV